MKFVVIGKDGDDHLAFDRRMSRRDAHLDHLKPYIDRGTVELAVGLKDENSNLVGSMIVFDCDSREFVVNWLKNEPYVEGDVWKTVEIFEGGVPNFD